MADGLVVEVALGGSRDCSALYESRKGVVYKKNCSRLLVQLLLEVLFGSVCFEHDFIAL